MLIAVLVHDPVQRSRVVEAMRGVGVVQFCANMDELQRLVFRPQAGGAIVGARDSDGQEVAPRLRRIKDELSHLPVVAYLGPDDDWSRDVVALVKAGAGGTVFYGAVDSVHTLRTTFTSARAACAATTTLEDLRTHLPSRLLAIAEYCLTQATRQLSVEEVARVHGVHRKTLNARFVRECGMQASIFLGWCRILASVEPILQRERSLEQAALALDWPSVGALRGMLKRYVGVKPSQLPALGGTGFVLRRFIAALEVARAGRAGVTVPDERSERIAG